MRLDLGLRLTFTAHELQATVQLNINSGPTETTFVVNTITADTVQDLHVS